MNGTLSLMPKPKKPTSKEPTAKTPRYPSRDKIKYAGIPSDYWDLLESLTVEGAKFEGRSVSFLTKLAVRAFLQSEGKLSPPPK